MQIAQRRQLGSRKQQLMVCAGHDLRLREAVTLVGGWQENVTPPCSTTFQAS